MRFIIRLYIVIILFFSSAGEIIGEVTKPAMPSIELLDNSPLCDRQLCSGDSSCDSCKDDCEACSNVVYVDDTHKAGSSLPGEAILGRFDYGEFLISGNMNIDAYDDVDFEDDSVSGPYRIDIVDEHFLVDNNDEIEQPDAQRSNSGSGTPDPCEDGSQSTNRYPFTVRQNDITVSGGIFHGYLPDHTPHLGIPQYSDWVYTYCNSAALFFKEASRGIVDGARVTSAWDGIRVDKDFLVENSWFSYIRDDVIENDNHHSGEFKDSLVDGAFQLFSQSGSGGEGGGSESTFIVSGSVLRIAAYPYKVASTGQDQRFGSLLKTDLIAPKVVLRNTVLAIDPDSFTPGGSTATWADGWDNTWSLIDSTECSNNMLLWMPMGNHSSLTSTLADVLKELPTECFDVVETDPNTARVLWQEARQNWINCHPRIGRMNSDPTPNHLVCKAGTYGGYTD